MGDTVSLRHSRWAKGKRVVYFYDGLLVAQDGVVTIPKDRPLWIRRAWATGWNLTPDGSRLWTLPQLLQHVNSAESAGEQVEDTDSGRQPANKDRVRTSQRRGSEGVSV